MRLMQTCAVLGILVVPALASAQTIKEPGNHPNYAAELEPHLVVQWNDYAPCGSDAFGPGFRATIPFLQNGPIPKINNNMGIGFGLDWAHSGINNNCNLYYYNNTYYGNGFTADIFTVPVVVQWNFFLTRGISVFGEGGLTITHTRYDQGYYNGCPGGGFCRTTFSDTGVDATFAAGGRFMVSDSVGFLLRLGFPYVSAGVSILL